MKISKIIRSISTAIACRGGTAYIVGGACRDHFLKLSIKDYDIEVHGIYEEQLVDILKSFGSIDLVGKSFGVYKLSTDDGIFDISIPRAEEKSGSGHTDFTCEVNPHLGTYKAAARRDFTCNAIYYDILNGIFVDHYEGIADIEAGILRHVSEKFSEDPLRVLRAFQFSSRFNFEVAEETIALCKSIHSEFSKLSTDRVWIEWEKWAALSINHERGIRFLNDSGWLSHFPLLESLNGIKQSAKYHPEGDTFQHTCHCLGAISRISTSYSNKALLAFSVLCHDLGKITHTQYHEDGKITSYGHEAASGPLSIEFLKSIKASNYYLDRVPQLVINHMFQNHGIHAVSVRRMAHRLYPALISDLCAVMECDSRGRPPLPDVCPDNITEIIKLAHDNNVFSNKPAPIVMGKHLIELGAITGRSMGVILENVFQAQLDGKFTDLESGIQYVRKYWIK